MLHIGCSGFPVPATRYLKEFMQAEIADTFLGIPGPALVRRWKREAPTGFVFTALAPKELTWEHFRPTAAGQTAWETFLPVARDLDATAIVVSSNPDTPFSKTTKLAARAMFEALPLAKLPTLVWDAPLSWELKDAESTVKDLPVIVARDPQKHPPFGRVARGYYRLPGPAGHKSRYEDPVIDFVASVIQGTQSAETFVVFTNVDMYADAKRLRRVLE